MEIKKITLTLLIYYFPAGLVFIIITAASVFNMDFAILSEYIFVPALSFILGFWAGGTDSYIKWSFPVYVALMAFCFGIVIYQAPNWLLIFMPFVLSLAGIVLRHFLRIRRRKWK